jgi:hypothetical protein
VGDDQILNQLLKQHQAENFLKHIEEELKMIVIN